MKRVGSPRRLLQNGRKSAVPPGKGEEARVLLVGALGGASRWRPQGAPRCLCVGAQSSAWYQRSASGRGLSRCADPRPDQGHAPKAPAGPDIGVS